MKKMMLVSLTLLLTVGLISGCKGRSANAGKEVKTLKTVKIASFYPTLVESSAIAKKHGFFEEELEKVGFKPEYSSFAQAGPALNEALAAKSIDFGLYADFPQLVLVDKGVNVRVIAPYTTAGHLGLIAGPNSGIKTPQDLEGKKVIVPKGTILQKIFENIVAEYGLDVDKIHQLNALSDQNSVYSSGEADAVIGTYTSMAILKDQSGGEIIFSTRDKPEWATLGTLVGRGEFLDENPDVAKALIRALYRGYKYAKENREKTFESLATEFAPLSLMPEIYGFDTSFSFYKPEFTGADIAKVDGVNSFLFEHGFISKKVDLNQFIDRSYYEAVKAEFE